MIRPCPSPSYSTPWSHDSGLLSPLQDIAVTVGAARTTNQGYGLASPSRAHTWPPSSYSTRPAHFLARREQEQGPPSSPVIVGEETLPSYTRNVMTSPYDSVGSWSSSYWASFESLPPPHNRSLYATIPLPDMDELGSVEGSRTHSPSDMRSRMSLRASLSSLSLGQGHPLPNPNPSQFPTYSPHASIDHWQRVRLHPVLENTGFPHSPLDYDNAAATMPSVDQITAMVASTGELFCILPSSRSPGIVTVGDVLEALQDTLADHRPACGWCRRARRRRQSCECRRMSISLNSLKLSWLSLNGTRPYPWQLLVEYRCQN